MKGRPTRPSHTVHSPVVLNIESEDWSVSEQMATTTRKSTGDLSSAPPVPFSYAEAAKGMSSGPSAAPSRVPSGSAVPSKDAAGSPPSADATAGAAPGQKASLDGEKMKENDNHSSANASTEAQASSTAKQPRDSGLHLPNGTANPPSPEFGTSSTSTLPREDDVSSLRNGSSESTWEVISQTSNNAEKSGETNEDKAGKDKGKKKSASKEKPIPKPLQEAPIPVVNIWKRRAEEAKAKAALQPSTPKEPVTPASFDAPPKSADAAAGSKPDGRNRGNEAPSQSAGNAKNGTSGDKSRERRNDDNTRRGRRMSLGPAGEEKPPPGSMSAPLPSMGDSELWPTPLTAKDEGKKKLQEKSGKENGGVPSAPKGKAGWINVPIEHSVVFQTPLPNTNPRRGGRGGRGRDGGNRGGANGQRGPGSGEKNETNETRNGEAKRSRQQTSRSTSPPKNQRGSSNGPGSRRESRISTQKEASEPSNLPPQKPAPRELTNSQNQNAQAGASSRNTTFPKPRQSRSADSAPNGGQSRDTEAGAAVFQPVAPTAKDEPAQSQRISNVGTDRDDGENGPPAERRTGSQSDAFGLPKYPQNDRRSGPYTAYNSRERFDRGRGNGRGRNGGHGFHHQGTGQPYTSVTVPGMSASHYGLPRSPTTFQQETYIGGQQQQPTGRQYRNPGRAQSIASEPMFNRMNNGFAGAALPPLQTFMGTPSHMYDYASMYPMTASVPYPPYVDPFGLCSMVRTQLEYYFSVDNLIKDVFLRSHMDSKGFVLLSFIANFNRLKQLTSDIELIKLAIQQSNDMEHRLGSDGKDRLRRREDWEKWVLPMNERNASAQNDGPESVSYPPPPQPTVGLDPSMAIRQVSMSMPLSPTSGVNPASQPMADIPPLINGLGGHDMTDAGAYPGLQTSPTSISFAGDVIHSPEPTAFGPPPLPEDVLNGPLETEPDDLPDQRIADLMVLEKDKPPKPNDAETKSANQHDASAAEQEESSTSPKRSQQLQNIGLGLPEDLSRYVRVRNCWKSNELLTLPLRLTIRQGRTASPEANEPFPALSPDGSLTGGTPSTASSVQYWVRDRDSPSNELPPDAKPVPYLDLRDKALSQRSAAAPGSCPWPMQNLYQFWSHFLVRSFNTTMYNEFRHLALDDADNDLDIGKDYLITFYAATLNRANHPIRGRIARHYVQLAKTETGQAERPATTRLQTAWRDGRLNGESRNKLRNYIDSELLDVLETAVAVPNAP